jgi:MFS family permease
MRKIPSWYIAFCVINVALGAFSQLLPLYAYFLGAKAAQVGLLSAVGSATTIVASLFWGRLADASPRRRPLVLFGFFGLAAGYALIAFLTSIGALFPLNVGVTFVWMAAGTAATLLVLAESARADWEKELGRFNAISGVGWTLGLLLGATWTTLLTRAIGEGWGLRSLGLVVALVALVAGLLSLRSVPEPMGQIKKSPTQTLTSTMGNFVAEVRRYGPMHFLEALNPRPAPPLPPGTLGFRSRASPLLLRGVSLFRSLFLGLRPVPSFLATSSPLAERARIRPLCGPQRHKRFLLPLGPKRH